MLIKWKDFTFSTTFVHGFAKKQYIIALVKEWCQSYCSALLLAHFLSKFTLFSLCSCCSQTGLQPHHRCGVWLQSGQCWWEDSQTADLGHCWARAIPVTSFNISSLEANFLKIQGDWELLNSHASQCNNSSHH